MLSVHCVRSVSRLTADSKLFLLSKAVSMKFPLRFYVSLPEKCFTHFFERLQSSSMVQCSAAMSMFPLRNMCSQLGSSLGYPSNVACQKVNNTSSTWHCLQIAKQKSEFLCLAWCRIMASACWISSELQNPSRQTKRN